MSRPHIRRAHVVAMAVVALTGLSVGAYYGKGGTSGAEVTAVPITQGDVIDSVGASGSLEALTTVQVGSQVSGQVQALYADFNSIVREGQLLARLDPSLLETQAEQARANLAQAEAGVERLRVALAEAEMTLQRTQALAARSLVSRTDLEAAEVSVRSGQAQLKAADAQVVQARASLAQTELNLRKTVITAPIDGIVVSRDVDVGQTVAASMQAPTLFLLAADLTKMRVNASVDESDIGRVHAGQQVRFRVDAFPADEFRGLVTQVRLQPVTDQNVVTYGVIIDVPNAELKLRPGMTANVTIEVARRENVLRVPNAALRFRPTEATFAALGQVAPAASSSPVGGQVGRRVWIVDDGTLTPVAVEAGVSDGVHTEISAPGLREGTEVVTRVETSETANTAQPTAAVSSPLLTSPPRPGPPPAGVR